MIQVIRVLGFLTFLSASLPVMANQLIDRDFLTVARVEVKKISSDASTIDPYGIYSKDLVEQITKPLTQADPIERAGRVIKIGRELVALGEEVYKLVDKGRPHIKTSYAPISVMPKVDGKAVDVMSTDYWSPLTTETYETNYYNLYNVNIVKFRYKVMFSYGGSYQGKGSYLTSVQIVPEYVHALFGFDFTANMILGGIANLSGKEDPVAEATLHIEYTIASLLKKEARVDTITVTGKGQVIKH